MTVLGASGGSRIFPAVFQVLVNLDWGLDPSAAVEFGRVHDQLFPMFVDTDNVYPADIVEDLKRRGHNITSTYALEIPDGTRTLTFPLYKSPISAELQQWCR